MHQKLWLPVKKTKHSFYVSKSCRILIMVYFERPQFFPIERQQQYRLFGMVTHAVILRRITKKKSVHARIIEQKNLGAGLKVLKICAYFHLFEVLFNCEEHQIKTQLLLLSLTIL